MRARGLSGTEVPVHVEDNDIINERRRSGRDIAYLKLVGIDGLWLDTAHFKSPFQLPVALASLFEVRADLPRGHNRIAC